MKPTVLLLYTAEQNQFAELHCCSTLIIFGSTAQSKGFFLVSNPASLIDLAALSPHPGPYQHSGGESELENGGKIIKLPLLLRQPLWKSSLTGSGYWILIFQAAQHTPAINLRFFLPFLWLQKTNSHFHASSYRNMYQSPPPPNFQVYWTKEVKNLLKQKVASVKRDRKPLCQP